MSNQPTPEGHSDIPPHILERYEARRDQEYQAFVESMVPHCRCKEGNRPCDGVLAGGLCDDVQDEPESDEDREDDDEQY